MKKTIHSPRSEALCAALREAREAADMTQQQVADALGRPQSYVAKYENGERRLDVIEFLDVVEILKINPAEILKLLNRIQTSK